MRKDGKGTSTPLPLSPRSANPATLSAQAVGNVLERFAPPRRLTHDLGFHEGGVTASAAAFGGTHILTGSSDGNVRLWDTASGICVRVFSCGDSTVTGIFTTPGTNRMVTTLRFGNTKIWDLENGDCLATLPDHPGGPVCCTDNHLFCRENSNLRNFPYWKRPHSKRSEVLVYEIATGRKTRAFPIEDSHIDSLAVSPDGGKIAVVTDRESVRIWDVASSGILHQSFRRLKRPVLAGFSPDSRSAVISWVDRIDIQDIMGSGVSFAVAKPSATCTTVPRCVLRGYRLIENYLESPSGGLVSHIRVIDIRTGETLYTNSFPGIIQSESITEEGRFCVGFRSGWIDVWDMENRSIAESVETDREYPGNVSGWNRGLAVNRRIVIHGEESVVRLVEPASGKPARMMPACQPLRDLLITPDGKGLLTMGEAAVKQWDLASGRCIREFSIAETKLRENLPLGAPMMAVTPDGRRLVLPSEGGVTIHDLPTGRYEGGFPVSSQPGPFSLHVTADGKRLMAVSGPAGFLGSYDLETGTPIAGFPLNNIGGFQAFGMGGPLLATANGWSLSLWDAQTGRLLRTWDHGCYVEDILFAPSHRQVITAGGPGFHFWDWAGGGPRIERPVHLSDVFTFGGSPCLLRGDRRLIVRGRSLIALWDIAAHKVLWGHDRAEKSRIRKIALFPDGKRLVAMDMIGIIQIRSVETGEALASLHVLPEGFIWETLPDDNAPSGWLWTDREDMITVIGRAGNDRNLRVFCQGEREHRTYLRIYNNRGMVMAKIAGREQYRRQVELYASAVDTARIGNGVGRLSFIVHDKPSLLPLRAQNSD